MDHLTIEPALPFYRGNFLARTLKEGSGKFYYIRNAVVFETQH